MNKDENSSIMKLISDIGIVPVIKLDDENNAVPLAKALCDGGIPAAEVTFRTSQAEGAIRRISAAVPGMLVGAGTVLTTEQVDRAVGAGAKFIVSPGLNPKVVSYCREKGIPVIPGCSNPSDIEAALELGLDTVKFFPAEAMGGVKVLKALSAPYGSVRFMPTGGISASNLNDYLSLKNVVACGGSWMVKPELIASGDFGTITALSREAVAKMLDIRLAHIGINEADCDSAMNTARLFALLLGVTVSESESSCYAGSLVEVKKHPGRGRLGHIAFSTNSVERTLFQLSLRGFRADETSIRRDASGRPSFAYLDGDFGGFAVHFVLAK